MAHRLERIRKLEHLLIPDCAADYITCEDIAQQQHLYLKLWEYHLELKEIKEEMRSEYEIGLIRKINDEGFCV